MPTPEQWRQFAETQNKYRYGQPAIALRKPMPAPNEVAGPELVARPSVDVDPLELTDDERRRAERNRTAVNTFVSNLLPADDVNYNKYSARTPMEERVSQLTAPRPVAAETRPAPTPLEAASEVVTPKLTSLGNGYGVAGANTSGRAGYSNRTYYDPSGNVVGRGLSSATGRGGFVGATTDAEADRNLKARFEQDAAARTMAASMNRGAEAMRELRAAQIADLDGYKPEAPAAPGLDQQKFNSQQNIDINKFLLDREKFNYQQGLDKERLAVDRSEVEGKQSARQLERKKYTDESRKAFASEFSFSDPKAPREQIAGAVFDISQATGVPTDVVSQFYEQAAKDLKINYSKGGPTDPMALNKLVAARITQAYQGQ